MFPLQNKRRYYLVFILPKMVPWTQMHRTLLHQSGKRRAYLPVLFLSEQTKSRNLPSSFEEENQFISA
jgi:hypothetical protein